VSDNPVYDYFDVVYLVAINLHLCRDVLNLTIDSDFRIPLLSNLLKEFAVMSLTSLDNRSQENQLFAVKLLQQGIENLVLRLAYHSLTAEIGIRLACPCIQQTHEVINLGNSTNGRSGIARGRLLFYRDNRTEPVDFINV